MTEFRTIAWHSGLSAMQYGAGGTPTHWRVFLNGKFLANVDAEVEAVYLMSALANVTDTEWRSALSDALADPEALEAA